MQVRDTRERAGFIVEFPKIGLDMIENNTTNIPYFEARYLGQH